MLLLILSLALAGAAHAQAPPAETREVGLVWTGATGGIGSGQWRFTVPAELRDVIVAGEGALVSVQPYHGAMARGPELLIASDRRVATLFTFLDGEPTCDAPRDGLALRTPTEVILVDRSSAPELVDALGGTDALEPVHVRSCFVDDTRATLVGPAGAAPPSDWTGFEVRLALTVRLELGGKTQLAEVVGLPHRDAARRIGLLEALRESDPEGLYVDAGSFVDGASSVRDQELSLHRPTGFEALRRLHPTALAPGPTELARGAAHFVEEAEGLPYVASNWRTNDDALRLPAVLRHSADTEAGPVDIAFLGALDPALARSLPALTEEGIWFDDPVDALQVEIDDLRRSDVPPDVIVVLSSAGGRVLRDLQTRLHHADLVIGDPGPATDRVREVEVTLRPPSDELPRPAWTLPLDGVGTATLEVAEDGLEGLHVRARRVTADLAPSPWVLERVNRVRRAEYPRLDRPLLPALAADPTQPMDRATWEHIVCEAVLERTGGDLALLPSLPGPPPLPGPQTELLVVDRLALLDEIEVHEIGGDLLQRLLDKAFEVVDTSCGAPLGERFPVVGGRPIDPLRTYRLITTDRMRADPTVAGLIAEGRSIWLLDQPTWRTFEEDGVPLTVRRATIEVLRKYQEQGADPVAELAGRTVRDVRALWQLRFDRAAFSVVRFQGADDERYSEIPETLATSPSSFTLSADLDAALAYSSRLYTWDLRAKTLYSRLDTDDETQEPSDDLRLSSSGGLLGARLPTGPLTWTPYAEALLDSEITPVVAEDGTSNPRQADMSLTLGLTAFRPLRYRVRVGAFGLRDLSVPDKATEYGARGELWLRAMFGPGLIWTGSADTFIYGDTPDDDVSDLRYKALFDTRVELPLARWLKGAVYGQAFLFRGRVPETSDFGASWTLGGALDLAGAFTL